MAIVLAFILNFKVVIVIKNSSLLYIDQKLISLHFYFIFLPSSLYLNNIVIILLGFSFVIEEWRKVFLTKKKKKKLTVNKI